MKASYSWLKQLVPQLPGPRALADRFTAAGTEVEGIHTFGAGIETCVLAWVVSIKPHPTKSGLRLVTVDRGGGTQEVICGAPNVPEPGGIVVLAPLGTHLPAKNMTIGRRDIGGVVSEGMLCSESELGLSEESNGILVLPPGFAEPGTRLIDAIPESQDTIFEIGLTPNRPDGLGHIGLAREAAALFGIRWTRPKPEEPTRVIEAKKAAISIIIADPDRCPHYAARIIDDVTIGASPFGVRYRLSALGVRSISTAVDVTNLVMFEYGHPMHAFDLDKVRGETIHVRLAISGETLATLDGTTRTLDKDDLVIADADGPIALAGVMGGSRTEITSNTKRILLECATFDPRSVRRAARRHGLHSESSHRFERGIDPSDTRDCILHASTFMARLCVGIASNETIRSEGKSLPALTVTLRAHATQRALGIDIPLTESKTILACLGFATKKETSDAIEFEVPLHRPDVTREIDLVEEVIRVRGMETVPAERPPIRSTRAVGGREALIRRVREVGVSLGLFEALTFGFTSSRSLAAIGAPPPMTTLANPLTVDLDAMRTSLLPGLLEALGRTQRHGEHDVSLFTTGVVFLGEANGLPKEEPMFAAVIAGERASYLSRTSKVDVWDAIGLANALVSRLTNASPTIKAIDREHTPPHLHPRGAGSIHVQNTLIGKLGPLNPDVAEALDLENGNVMIVELELNALANVINKRPQYTAIPRFPASTRDVAIVVKQEIPVGDVLAAVRESAGTLAETVRIFDRFTGSPVPDGYASLAFRVVYRASDRTLTDAEIDQSHTQVVSAMTTRFGATLRS